MRVHDLRVSVICVCPCFLCMSLVCGCDYDFVCVHDFACGHGLCVSMTNACVLDLRVAMIVYGSSTCCV